MLLLILRYLITVLVYMFLLIICYLPAAIFVPMYYRAQPDGREDRYTWGGLFGTFDNPPQGDRGWVSKRSPFPNVITGFKGYINRVGWMLRNPLYGFARQAALWWKDDYRIEFQGNENISDKYKVPGYLITRVFNGKGKMVAFELYTVLPWSKSRNLRMRLGWKAKSRKVQETGMMQFVFTINPFDGYGDD